MLNPKFEPMSKDCFRVNLSDKVEKSKIVSEIPTVNVYLYNDGRNRWSASMDGRWKTVEDATADFFVNNGWKRIGENYITTCKLSCFLATEVVNSKFWRAVLSGDRTRFIITPRMYDEGYPLSTVWKDTPPRFGSKDKQIVRSFVEGLPDDFTSRDVLIHLIGEFGSPLLGSKADITRAISLLLKLKRMPEVQAKKIQDASVVFTKHITNRDIRDGNFIGSVSTSVDIDAKILEARSVTFDRFQKVLPDVREAFQDDLTKQRNRHYWTSFRSVARTEADKRIKLDDFVNSGKIDHYGQKIHGDNWHSLYRLNDDPNFLSDCCAVFGALGGSKLVDYALLDQWRFVRSQDVSGQSDLVMWTGSEVKFVEVKSPNDRLRDNQIDRFNSVMRPAGLDYSIAKVIVR